MGCRGGSGFRVQVLGFESGFRGGLELRMQGVGFREGLGIEVGTQLDRRVNEGLNVR